MKAKTIIPLFLGLGVGFFAVKMGIDLVKKAQGAQGSERLVLVSAKTIEVATKITDSMLTTTKVVESLVPPNSFTDEKALVGRVSAMTISAGVPITTSMLAPAGAEPGLAAIIPRGHRAVAVSVNEESAVGGFILPGAHVDVSTVDEKSRTSKLILTDVEVGAVGQSLSEVGSDGKTTRITKSVTLFLEPHEVQTLHAHSGKGRIRLAMRGPSDDPGSSWSKILVKALATPPQSPPPQAKPKNKPSPSRVVEVVRGSDVQTLVFDPSGRLQGMLTDPAQRAVVSHPANTASQVNPETKPPEAIE